MNADQEHMTALLSALSHDLSADDILFAHYASEIAVAITSKRIELGLTQKELADKLNKSQATISKWESADCNFTLKTLIEIAQSIDLRLSISLEDRKDTSGTPTCDNVTLFPGPSGWASATFYEDEELEEM